jgi:glycogen operon protein
MNIPGAVDRGNGKEDGGRGNGKDKDLSSTSPLPNMLKSSLGTSPKVFSPLSERKPAAYVRHYHSKLPEKLAVYPGKSYPLGATWDGAGVNFAIFSEFGSQAYLCLFDTPESAKESHRIKMPEYDDFVFHCYLPEIRPGQLYGFRVDGDWDPQNGLRFNKTKVLLDPYAKAIGRDVTWDDSLFPYNIKSLSPNKDLEKSDVDNAAFCPLGMVVDSSFTWGNDSPPNVPWHRSVIYETHVKSQTLLHPDVPEHIRGTYAGLCSEPFIMHLKKLGVTAIELEPIHHHVDEKNLLDKGLVNHWGYNTLSFFAPDLRYCATNQVLGAVQEFKTMVRVLHSHGIEVILDVVYNHTAEGNHFGPVFNFKGADNLAYYKTVEGDERYYFDYTGCGNSLNVRHPRVLQLIMDSLRYWILEMHVDGFRFDLASALARHFYAVDKLAAFFDIIHQDPVISRVKLIAEPWDVGSGGYQVGNFPVLWTEWNGKYRDSIRGFWNGKGVTLGELATRISGSSDLYTMDTGRTALASINFITCHDGFDLVDLVSYNHKHNEANGENNNDGANDNLSWNHGVEGPTDDPGIVEFRWRQRANFLTTLFVSLGVPMITGGDELSMTQQGNNNTYCQDNELTWFNWDLDDDAEEFLDFTRQLIQFRKSQAVLCRRRHLRGDIDQHKNMRDIIWYLPEGREPAGHEWHDKNRQCLGYVMNGNAITDLSAMGVIHTGPTLLILMNANFHDVNFRLPTHIGPTDPWQLVLSTDRSLRSKVNTVFAPNTEFLMKDHSISIFQLSQKREVRRHSRINLADVKRIQYEKKH